MPATNPRLIVHVGFPKCGSTSIQKTLSIDYKNLDNQGIKVVGAVNIDTFVNKVGRFVNTDDTMIAGLLLDEIQTEILDVWKSAILDGSKAVVVSSEHIIYHFKKFISLLPEGVKIEVVAVVRNLDEWLQSTFLQELKNFQLPPKVTFNEYLDKAIEAGVHHHTKYLEMIEFDENVSKISILGLRDSSGLTLTTRFYTEILKVEPLLKSETLQNQSISLDQGVILRSIRLREKRKLTDDGKNISAMLRLAQLVSDQEGEHPIQSSLQNDFQLQISKENSEYVTWLEAKCGVVIDGRESSRKAILDFDAINHVSRRGLRLLVRSFVRLWIEMLDIEQNRGYEPDFTAEFALFNSKNSIESKTVWNLLKDDLRELQELLTLVSIQNLFGVEDLSNRKSPSTRMLEILQNEISTKFDFFVQNPQQSEFQDTRISATSIDLFIAIGMQVAWEIFNASERDWIVDISQNEYRLAGSIDTNLSF